MRSLLFSFILFLLIIFANARDILDEEEARDVQRYCDKYASCRKSARQQFEKCAGGFSKMIVAQTDTLRIKPSSRSGKCEKQLLLNIAAQIKPVYEKIEQDTFECTKSADPNAFNLDQSQTLICKAIQQEVGLDNFAINGAQGDTECRNTYESQMQRCDLVKECCPQFTHCHTKAELETNVYGKEEKLATQLDECIGYSQGSPKSGSYKHEEIRKSQASKTPESSTTPPEADEASTATSIPTLPPPEKVFNDLVKALFPGLVPSSTAHPSPSAEKSSETEAATTTESIFEKVNEIRKKQASSEKYGLGTLSEISQWKAVHDKLEQLKAKSKAKGLTASTTTTTTTTTATKAIPVPASTKPPPSTEPEIEFSHDSFISRRRSRIHTSPLIGKDSIAFDSHQKEALSRVYCENLMECEAVVETQFDLCDQRYKPEDDLFGIAKQSLRAQFLSNSNVTDRKVKRRCLEAVDPESQRQLSMLETFVIEQNHKCTRKAAIPSITSDKFEQCQNVHLISVISEMFTNKNIPEGKTPENAEKCYARVGQLQGICNTIRRCCPQNSVCANNNHSSEYAKYREIIEQLKDEQTLCEKRRMRILNGLV